MTRACIALAIVAAASAASCKADRSRPLDGADAAAGARTPIASGAGGETGAAGTAGGETGAAGGDTGAAGRAADAGAAGDAAAAPPTEPAGDPGTKGGTGSTPPPEPKSTGRDDGKAGKSSKGDPPKKPRNVKSLPSSWSLAQVTSYMKKQVSPGLGVECDHCHDESDYAADGNEHKQAARHMIAMTGGLNRQYFRGKQVLTCSTCHKGQEKPKP